MARYLYQHKNWTDFHWDETAIQTVFGDVRHLQGRISGFMQTMGFETREELKLSNLSLDAVKSAEIEGEWLDMGLVRSSVARRLGIPTAGWKAAERTVEGMADMLMDATQRYRDPLTEQRLFGWHAALFPTGYSGLHRVEVARYRSGEMQIVSGPMGRERVHYEAVPAERVKSEMDDFLDWCNRPSPIDSVLKAGLAHLRFIIIHPFDDGNGRMARAITDMLLSRAEDSRDRFYSMSSQMMKERNRYYEVLRQVQHSTGDVTEWLEWYLHCLRNALQAAEDTCHSIGRKADFWRRHEQTVLNERQRLVLNKLLDGFEGKLKTSIWARMAKCSQDTALRDIQDLIDKGILSRETSGGRSTNYALA